MRKILLFLACLYFFIGCRQASEKRSYVDSSYADSVVQADLQIKIGDFDPDLVLKYSDVYEKVSYVKLETLDNSLIGNIDKIVATEDKFIIMDQSLAKMVFVFNRDGKFLNRIGSVGGGPEEYDEPSDIAYDKYYDDLLVLCHNKKTILRYKLNGTFVGKTTFDWWVRSIFVIDDNAYLLFFNNNMQPNRKKNNYNITIIDKEGQILKNLLPYDEKTGKLSPPMPTFSYYENEILFKPYYSNTVYNLDNNEIKPKYYLDFGDRKVPNSLLNDNSSSEVTKLIREREYAYCISSYETSTHIISQFSYKRIIYDCFYSKESGNVKIACTYVNDMCNFATNRGFTYVAGESLIGNADPDAFTPFKEHLKKKEKSKKEMNEVLYDEFNTLKVRAFLNKKLVDNLLETYKTTKINVTNEEVEFINSIDESDNPILMIAELKKF